MSESPISATINYSSLAKYSMQEEWDDSKSVQTQETNTAFSLATSSSFASTSLSNDSSSCRGDSSSSSSSNERLYGPTKSKAAQSALQELNQRLQDHPHLSSSCSLHLDSMMESFDLHLLTQFYDELMIPNFPLEEERDDLQDWLMILDPQQRAPGASSSAAAAAAAAGNSSEPSMDVLIHRATDSTGNNHQHTILGGIAFEYYPQAKAGLLSYMVVSPKFRRLGLLATLHPVFTEALQGLHELSTNSCTPIAAILAETNTTTAGDVPLEVAQKRHLILYKLGYRLLHFPYVQPPLERNGESFDDIMLLVYVGNNKHENSQQEEEVSMPTQVLYDYVLDFYRSVFGYTSSSEDENDDDFRDHWYYQLVTWYAQQHPTTRIQVSLPPWKDCTPIWKERMLVATES